MTAPRRNILQTARSLLFSLSGEGMQSGFHFALNLSLIKLLSAYDFGLFAIVFALGAVALNYLEALVSIPATVRIARLTRRSAIDYHDVAFGSVALTISAAMGVALALGLWFTLGHITAALAGGAFVTLWTLRHHVRSTVFARHEVTAATAADFSYAVCGIVFVALALAWPGHFSRVTGVLLALAAAHAAAIVIAFAVLRVRPRASLRRSIWQRYGGIRTDVGWSLVGVVTWSVQSQALLVLVAAFAGPAAWAPIAAGMVLLSPMRPAIVALINVFRPKFARALAEHRIAEVRTAMYSLTAMITLACLCAATLIWLGWPCIQAHLFAEKFAYAPMALIVALCGSSMLIALTYFVPLAMVQAAGDYRSIALATTFGAIAALSAVPILLSVTTVAWSLAGMAAGEAVCGAYLWFAAHRILRQRSAASHEPPVGASQARA